MLTHVQSQLIFIIFRVFRNIYYLSLLHVKSNLLSLIKSNLWKYSLDVYYISKISIVTSYDAVYSSCKTDDHMLFERDLEDTSYKWDTHSPVAQEGQIVRRIHQFLVQYSLANCWRGDGPRFSPQVDSGDHRRQHRLHSPRRLQRQCPAQVPGNSSCVLKCVLVANFNNFCKIR